MVAIKTRVRKEEQQAATNIMASIFRSFRNSFYLSFHFLAGCWNINLLKAAQNFGDIYPDMCKKYFDLLAKKRFNSDEKNEGDSRKKSKSVLEKKYEEKKAKGILK